MATQHGYENFIAGIDNSQARKDQYGNLSWHVDCSSQGNAGDTAVQAGTHFHFCTVN